MNEYFKFKQLVNNAKKSIKIENEINSLKEVNENDVNNNTKVESVRYIQKNENKPENQHNKSILSSLTDLIFNKKEDKENKENDKLNKNNQDFKFRQSHRFNQTYLNK